MRRRRRKEEAVVAVLVVVFAIVAGNARTIDDAPETATTARVTSTSAAAPPASTATTWSARAVAGARAAPTVATVAGKPIPEYGPSPAYRPVVDTMVQPGRLTQALLDAKGPGHRFGLAAGVHRLTAPLRPHARQQFLGLPGARVSGSKVLRGWVRDGARWYVAGQRQRLPRHPGSDYGAPICRDDSPLCNHPEDVFVDDVPRRQVASLAALRAGTFFFDYAASRIYLAENPAAKTIETTVSSGAFVDGGPGNVYRNLVVEEFGNAAQSAVIRGNELRVDRVTVRRNHGTGIAQYGGRITNSRIVANGQLGLAGGGHGLVVAHNEIAHNNAEGHNAFWEAGGTKWAMSTLLTVRDNWVHHNAGSGLSTDINNFRSLYERNVIEDNEDLGVHHEISYDAIIRNNLIRRNGYGQHNSFFTERGGISVTNSRNVQIYGNRIEDNHGGGVLGRQDLRIDANEAGTRASRGRWLLERLDVHDNHIRTPNDATGAFFDWHTGLDIHPQLADRNSFYTQRGNRFRRNAYVVPAGLGPRVAIFLWRDAGGDYHDAIDWAAWRRLGQDTSGSLRTAAY